MATLKRQKGSTLLGFIIGLITGLIIAVIVALVITKTSIPFADKNEKLENTPTSTVKSETDPNKALYGNREAPKPVSKENTNTEPSAIRTDPVTIKETNANATLPVKATSSEDKSIYYLQAGAYHKRSDAENMRGNLALLGFESRISEATSKNGDIYRVRLGPYKSNTINKAHSKLMQNGINTTITRSSK